MEKEEFTLLLEKAQLTKKEFAEILGINQGSLNNWGSSQNIPYWVKSWLYYYMKAKENKTLQNIINPIIERELRKRELSSMLDTLLSLDIEKLIEVFEDVASVWRKITYMASNSEKITKKFLASELEGMTMSTYTNFNKTFFKIHSISKVMLDNSDTDILFEFGR